MEVMETDRSCRSGSIQVLVVTGASGITGSKAAAVCNAAVDEAQLLSILVP